MWGDSVVLLGLVILWVLWFLVGDSMGSVGSYWLVSSSFFLGALRRFLLYFLCN